MRLLVSAFLVSVILLLIVQKVFRDDNYFIPTMVLVLAANFVVIFSVKASQFDTLEHLAPVLRLLLERPQLILYFGLMLMAFLPPILWNSSFTCYFSRVDYPVEVWQTREFVLVNKYLSYFWVIVFFLCFISQFVPILLVQLLAPLTIVLTLGNRGTKMLIAFFIKRLDAEER
jgi:hypothetical protein